MRRYRLFKLFALTRFLSITIILIASASAVAGKYPSNYVHDWNSPRITIKQIALCPVADGFDFPVGKPNAKGYYNAQGFKRNNHLADDWNGTGGGNTDLNDPIYSIANGIVVQAKNHHGPWGRVTRILHNAGSKKNPIYVESLYAHMRTIIVKPNMIIKRGQKIGTIGNAGGSWWAHLHLEIRTTINKSLGVGYSTDTTGYVSPTAYIKRHRPYWRTASYKRRLTMIAAKKKKLELARLAKVKSSIPFTSSEGTLDSALSSLLKTIRSLSDIILDVDRYRPETLSNIMKLAAFAGITSCESTSHYRKLGFFALLNDSGLQGSDSFWKPVQKNPNKINTFWPNTAF